MGDDKTRATIENIENVVLSINEWRIEHEKADSKRFDALEENDRTIFRILNSLSDKFDSFATRQAEHGERIAVHNSYAEEIAKQYNGFTEQVKSEIKLLQKSVDRITTERVREKTELEKKKEKWERVKIDVLTSLLKWSSIAVVSFIILAIWEKFMQSL